MVILVFPTSVVYAVDRLFLAPTCPACHTDMTKNLPLFDPSREGLVRIRASGMEFRARIAGFNNREGEGVICSMVFLRRRYVAVPAGQTCQSWIPRRRL